MNLLLNVQLDRSDDFESIYRAYYLATDARHTRIAIAIWLIPVLLFAYLDYLVFGNSLTKSATPYSLSLSLIAIVMANVLGGIFSSSLEKHRRTEFKARLDERQAKEELNRLASLCFRDNYTIILQEKVICLKSNI